MLFVYAHVIELQAAMYSSNSPARSTFVTRILSRMSAGT